MQPEAQAALRRVWLKQEQARYRQRSQTQVGDIQVWRQLGRICWELGELEPALDALDRALELQPNDIPLLLDRLVLCLHLNRLAELLTTTDFVLTQFPDHADALLFRVEAFRRLERWREGLAACDWLLALPDLNSAQRAAALSARIALLCGLNRIEEALAVVEEALVLTPADPILGLQRVTLWVRLERFAEILESINGLLAMPETRFGALCAQAQALAALRRFDEADAILEDLQARYPHQVLERLFEPWRLAEETFSDSLLKRYTARGLYLIHFFAAQAQCDWTERDKVLAEIESFVDEALRYGFVAGIEPFRLLALPIAPALQLAVARAQAVAVAAHMAPIREKIKIEWPSTLSDGRLRIGYVSGDFRDHATAHLARKLFQVHDRSRFEIIGFSLQPDDGSTYHGDIVAGCDRFVELTSFSHTEAALRIAQEGIHLLVDLHGYTRFARPELFALHPAPLQVAFLGYPGTLGAEYIPYLIADPVVLPAELQPWFTEYPVYLPDCYQINDDEQPIAVVALTRAEVGLPEDAFVFCCFNAPYKIEPTAFTVWMRILLRTPGSVLWLLAGTSRCADRLRAAAREQGVAPERLIFAPRLPKAEHLQRHQLANLYLDTFVVNAHTTASDALWAELPVLTLRGTTFQSRVCASLLTALGLTELIASDQGDYESLAVALAYQPERLRALREMLALRRLDSPPFLTIRFVRQLEQAFKALWDMWVDGKPPQLVSIQAND